MIGNSTEKEPTHFGGLVDISAYTEKEQEHSRCSPSASSRWLKCPGSIQISKDIPQTFNIYNTEGLAAHKLAEVCWHEAKRPEDYLATEVSNFVVNQEMVDSVTTYLETMATIVFADGYVKKSARVDVEKRVKVSEDVFGTVDCRICSGETLSILDFKYGIGVVVDPKQNTQEMIYALGAIMDLKAEAAGYTSVELIIVQPRAFHPEGSVRRWCIPAAELFKWRDEVLTPAVEATYLMDPAFAVGKHCQFCPASGVCFEQTKVVTEAAMKDKKISSPEHLSKALAVSKDVARWLKDVKAYALREMMAGVTIPGFKLVEGRKTRRWINEMDTVNALDIHLHEDVYNKSVISPAGAEKALKALGIKEPVCGNLLESLYEKTAGGLVIAPAEDKRAEASPENSVQFSAIEGSS